MGYHGPVVALARRVLLVDPDLEYTERVLHVLKQQGLEGYAVADAETGLRKLATVEPDVLLLEMNLGQRDGIWFLRRLRDEYMGRRPRVGVMARPEALSQYLGDLGVDLVVTKPVGVPALWAAVTLPSGDDWREQDAKTLAELVKASVLTGETQSLLWALAKRLTLALGAQDCVVSAAVGGKPLTCSAAGWLDLGPESPMWKIARVALWAGAPLFVSYPEQVRTFCAFPLTTSPDDAMQFLMFCHEAPRLFHHDLREGLWALSQRLAGELKWRSVHERIVADRNQLRRNAMLDPMLSVLTRAALDRVLPQIVSTCLRRRETFVMAILDVRGLRHINEKYGHKVGDALLCHVATLVRSELRAQDVLGRYAGDALALVLGNATVQEAQAIVERLMHRVAHAPLLHENVAIPVALDAGVAPFAGGPDRGEDVLSRAVAALKNAKRQGQRIWVTDASGPGEVASEEGLESGTTVGGMYQVMHEISRGAMGVVYRAEDLALGRQVALKTLHPDLARDKNFVDRFRNEAAILASIRNDHLVQVHAFGIDGGCVYFVMELVEGVSLEDQLVLARKEGRHLPTDQIVGMIQQTALALDGMHHVEILHRDVKPANILLDRVRDRAVLVDVGIAKKKHTPTEPAGTPGFMAPETYTGEMPEGPATDVYGLAATAYLALTLTLAFEGDSVDQVIALQKAGPPPSVTSYRPGLPSPVNEIFARALNPTPAQRYASAGAFASALSKALIGETA